MVADAPTYDVRRDYALGRSQGEAERLVHQSTILEPFTERLLKDVGLKHGMQVLDLGCGTGDGAILAAKIVGRAGRVVGIDHNPDIIDIARQRAAAAGLQNIAFREAAVETFEGRRAFDVVMGRCVAFFAVDPVAFLRAAAKAVRPGGRVALQEPNARWLPTNGADENHGQFSSPKVDDIERVGEAFARGLAITAPGHDVALRMAKHFIDAGLEEPNLSWNILVGSGSNSPIYGLLAASFKSIYPQLARHGIQGFDDLNEEGLEVRLGEQAVSARSQVSFYTIVSAWAELR